MLPTGGFFRSNRKLWAACLLVVLIVGACAQTLIWELRHDALRGMEKDTSVVGDVLAAQTSRYLQLVDAGLRRIQAAVAMLPSNDPTTVRAQFGGEDAHTFLHALVTNLPQANAFLIVESTGMAIGTSRDTRGQPIDDTDRDYFRVFLGPTPPDLYVSAPMLGRATGVPVIFLARRMVGSDGQFAGVAVAVLDAGYFRRFYESLNMGASRGVTLLRNDGTILVRFPETVAEGGAALADIATWKQVAEAGGGTFHSSDVVPKMRSIVSVHPLADFPLVVNVSLREVAALAPWQTLIRLIEMQAAIAAAAVVLVFSIIVRQLRRLRTRNLELAGTAAALRDSEQRLRHYAEMASDWFWEQGANLRFSWTSASSPAHRIGGTSDGLTRWEQVGADPTDPGWAAHIADLNAHRPFRDFRYERVGIAGDVRHVSVSGAPVFDADGQFAGYRGIGRDVTGDVEAARELREARDRAETASKAKSEFLANMSHELRTPLNAIIGFSELIAGQPFGKIEPRYAEFAEDILSGGKHLLDLINDLLDMSKIEAGQFDLADERIELAPLVLLCANMVAPRAAEGRVTIAVADALPRSVLRADRRAVRQIVLNLLSNAVKFTPAGGSVAVRLEAAEDGMAVVVEDTGIGIPKDALARLCEPFQQVDASIGRRFGGTGLGLAITQKLLALHGGTLRFDSEPGRGTTVWAIFPAERIVST
jgi:signal transduction histidine kinase